MRHLFAALLLAGFATAAAFAAGPTLFQHGGRATAQAGAFTARAVASTAVAYNPAAIARLPGLNATAGLDFTAPRDDYRSTTGEHAANHIITFFPALYVTYHVPEDRHPFAFGIGIDNQAWHHVEWDTALFPARRNAREAEVTLWRAHPVVAYELDERWSIGGGLVYYHGTLGDGRNGLISAAGTHEVFTVEVERLTEVTATGYGADLGIHFEDEAWGWGLVAESGAEIDGSGGVTYTPRDIPAPQDPVLIGNIQRLLPDGRGELAFELPWELRTGFWVAPYPELRMAFDLAWAGWSVVDQTQVVLRPDPFTRTAVATETRRRDWDDTLSARLGLEGDVADHWMLSAGVAWEPSPVPGETLEPGFPRGDALVYAVGFSYHLPKVAFDLGYSFHQLDDREITGLEAANPRVTSIFESRNQVWSFSASWRW